jgi:hypothetical protein
VSECSELDQPQTPSTPSFDEGFAQPCEKNVQSFHNKVLQKTQRILTAGTRVSFL